ncbi:Uncharacterized protein MLTONO_3217 [Mesorhizobium loti]|nr:Uncharacterized protein MLTONO_3217 [Mesorhizobium loti]
MKIADVYTVERVAGDLGITEELIRELPHDLELEGFVICVHGANDDDGILAFSPLKALPLQGPTIARTVGAFRRLKAEVAGERVGGRGGGAMCITNGELRQIGHSRRE